MIFKNNVIIVIFNKLRMNKKLKKTKYLITRNLTNSGLKKLFINCLEKMKQVLL